MSRLLPTSCLPCNYGARCDAISFQSLCFCALRGGSRAWLAENHIGRYVTAMHTAAELLIASHRLRVEAPGAGAMADGTPVASTAKDACQPRCESVAGMLVSEGHSSFLQVSLSMPVVAVDRICYVATYPHLGLFFEIDITGTRLR